MESIQRGRRPIQVHTNKGRIEAKKVLVTVSTGVLAADQIRFDPPLPDDKVAAIQALPMGNYNNLIFELHRFDEALPESVLYQDGEVCLAMNIQPFSKPYVFTCVGGRFAWWLEKQGPAAAQSFFEEALCKAFGNDLSNQLRSFKCSAWGYDPLIRGGYSSALPGRWSARAKLGEPLDSGIFFAGEAVSQSAFNTAHGAYQSGHQAVEDMCWDLC